MVEQGETAYTGLHTEIGCRMTRKVSSYAAGSWYVSPEPGAIVRDPTTGVEVAEVSSAGLDVGAMVEHARSVGGPALRALTFHERAGLLKRLAAALSGRTDEVYADYATSGGTRADARVDVEGGIQVLSFYAKRATRELPNDTVIVEREPEALLGRPDFVGQTIFTSRNGLAVLINAYNFPVWGMLEKLAQCLLAGLPVIVKPASVTAHLTEVAFRHIVDSGVLPQGAVQLISGSAGSLLDHLGGQDHVSFTGSAQTAAILRAHPAVVARGASFNSEADSLNATILGPNAGPDTDEFALFVKAVVGEMSSKCGQKCTAIRRVLVPSEQLDAVIVGVRERLDRAVIGDPRDEATTIGPLVSADQRAEVESAVRRIMESATVAIGGPDVSVGPSEASGQEGFFAPTLLVASDRRDPRVHSVEAFGPVATVVPYDSASEAVELTALGEGSLVASVVSADSAFVREIVRGIAPFHGRVFVLNQDIARGSAPHGAVLPQLIHGGPGRAGGGEELGGMRGVRRLLQATSVASSAQMNVALTDSWNAGAAELTPQVHPFRLHLEELRIGDTLHTGSRTVTLEDIQHFAEFTGDTFYAHMDEEAAKASPLFEGRVAHGYFIIAAAAGLFVDPDPGPVLANFGLEALRFLQPVYPGDEIKLRLTAKKKTVRPGTGWGEVTWDVEVTNQRDETVATYQLLTINASKDAKRANSPRTTTGLAPPQVSYARPPSARIPARQSSTKSDTRARTVMTLTRKGHTMSEITDTLTMIQQEMLRQIRTGQAVTVEATRIVSDFVASTSPNRGRSPWMPQVSKEARKGQQEAIDAAFAFVRAVLELNVEFARSLSRLPASTQSSKVANEPAMQSVGTMPAMSAVPAMPVMPSLAAMPAMPVMTAMPGWPNPTAVPMPTIPGWSSTFLADIAREAAAATTAAFGAAGSAALEAASATRSAAAGESRTETPGGGTKPKVAKRAATPLQTTPEDEGDGAANESASTPVKKPAKSPTGTARKTSTAPATAAATKKSTATRATAKKPTTKKKATARKATVATSSAPEAAAQASAPEAAAQASAPKAAAQASAPKAAAQTSAAKDEAAETPAAAVDLPEGAVAGTEDGSAPEGYDVKGNAESGLYHVPGSQWYDATEAKLWFASAEDAERAGFKPAGGAAKQQAGTEDSSNV